MAISERVVMAASMPEVVAQTVSPVCANRLIF